MSDANVLGARAGMRPLVLAALLVVGCEAQRTNVDDVLPERLTGEAYFAAEAAGEPGERDPMRPGESDEAGERLEDHDATRWWTSFEDPVLDELVDAVLAGNLDLAQAAASVREADARARAAHGARFPTIDVDASGSRNRNFFGGIGTFYFTNFTTQASIAWQTDLFGRLRATERARLSDVLATEADRVGVAHSLVEQAVRRRIDVSVLDRRLALARDIVDSRSNTLQIVEGRYERGVRSVSAVDVHLARENLAAARTVLPALERGRQSALFATDVLLGQQPGDGFELETLNAPLPTTPPPPTGVPAQLLDRRPDLIASRMRLEAAAADLDASVAALYPDLTLSASGGWAAEDLEDLFDAETLVANVLAGISAPIFAGGRLEAEVDANRARLESLGYAHASQVLGAVREVNEALISERRLREELEARTEQRDEARLAEELARERYQRGLESLLTVLDTERRRANAEDQLLVLQADVWNARIDLHLALGGDWFVEEGNETE